MQLPATPDQTSEPASAEMVPVTPAGLRRISNRISGDKLLQNIAHLSKDQQDAILWLHDYTYKLRLDYDEIGPRLRKPGGKPYSGHQVYMVFRGQTENRDIPSFCEAIKAFRSLVEQRAQIQRATFTETSISRKIWQGCDAARIYQRVTFLIGDTQIGKTINLEEYTRRNNHGKTHCVRMPEGGRLVAFVREFCRQLNIPDSLNVQQSSDRIIRTFRDDMLLIVDEAHQPFICGEMQASYRVFEFIREIFDRTGCGLVLSATDILPKTMKSGRYRQIFSQLTERELCTVHLPAKPSAEDLDLFAAKYQLAPASGDALKLQSRIIADRSIGYWLTMLTAGSRIAGKAERAMEWSDVLDAHATIEALNRGGAR